MSHLTEGRFESGGERFARVLWFTAQVPITFRCGLAPRLAAACVGGTDLKLSGAEVEAVLLDQLSVN